MSAPDLAPRRCRLDCLTPLEVAAFDLIRACEVAGGHPQLTDAQRKAIEAKDILADWIDGGAPGARDDQPWIKKAGPWLPGLYDPDWPRPWLAADEPCRMAELPPQQSASALRDLAVRLTPNPALSVEGTLAIILDGIDRLDDEMLARSLGHVGARQAGLDAQPLSDEQWAAADPATKQMLIHSARALKLALREMSK
jgi:hypothetical protein